MKVLLVNREVGTGSVGKIVEDLYYGIVNSGNECHVVYGNKNKSAIPANNLIYIGNKFSIGVHILYSRLFDRSGFFGKKQTKRLIKEIEMFKPDIIHFHGLYGYWLNIVPLFKYLASKDIRVIDTLHSCWDFTGHCCYFTKANCLKWQSKCFKCPEKRSYPKSILLDQSKRNYEQKKSLFLSLKSLYLISPSNWMNSLVSRSFLSQFPIKTINNGINLDSFKYTILSLDKYGVDITKKIVLGVASNWDDRKGLSDFIDLSKHVPTNFQLVVVGLNDNQIRSLPKSIIGIKKTENKEELAALYSAATVLFNPTHEDNYPTVNLEAIACGTPVITYDVGGSPESIRRHNYGLVIQKKDFKTIINYVNAIKKRAPTAIENYCELDKRIMIAKHMDYYKRILSKQ